MGDNSIGLSLKKGDKQMFGKKRRERWIKEYEAKMMRGVPAEQQNVTTEDRLRGRTPRRSLEGIALSQSQAVIFRQMILRIHC